MESTSNNFNVDKIVLFLEPWKNKLPELYKWEVNPDTLDMLKIFPSDKIHHIKDYGNHHYEKAVALKKIISPKLHKLQEREFKALCSWIIKEWGRIKSSNNSNDDQLINKIWQEKEQKEQKNDPFDRISSRSKIRAFMNPAKDCIYDSRVIYTLNWIILSEDAGDKFFPIPSGRNSNMMAFDVNVLIHLKHKAKAKKELFVNKEEAYSEFNKLIKNIHEKLWNGEKADLLYDTEMLLFAIAGKEIIKDIIQRTNIDIKSR